MAKIIAQITARLPRLMEASEYRKLRYAGGKPSLQQLKKWIEEGEVLGEVKGGMYFVDLQAAIMGSSDPCSLKCWSLGNGFSASHDQKPQASPQPLPQRQILAVPQPHHRPDDQYQPAA